MTKLYNIIIIDTNNNRAKAIAKVCCESLRNVKIYIFPSKHYKGEIYIPDKGQCFTVGFFNNFSESDNFTTSSDEDDYFEAEARNTLDLESHALPEIWDLAFRHYRDDEYVLLNIVKLEIWYGAGGAESNRSKTWNINSILSNPDSVRSALEVKATTELLTWAFMSDDERNIATLPRLLKKPIIKYVPALTLLCKGFLIAQIGKPSCLGAKTEEAFKKMGWHELPADQQEQWLNKITDFERDRFCETKYWLQILGSCKKLELENCFAQEFYMKGFDNSPSVIMSFIDSLCSISKLSQPEIVAEVYLALAEKS